MNVSGILAVIRPEQFESGLEALRSLPGLEVHQTDAATGRAVVTQEAETIGAEVDGLKTIKALPDVLYAELVFHGFELDEQVHSAVPAELNAMESVGQTRTHLDKA